MKTSEIRDLNDIELKAREKELAEELFNLKFRHASGQLENTASIPKTKKDLARIKTIIRERELARKDQKGSI